jgi:hypothetical protein
MNQSSSEGRHLNCQSKADQKTGDDLFLAARAITIVFPHFAPMTVDDIVVGYFIAFADRFRAMTWLTPLIVAPFGFGSQLELI